MMLLTGFVPEEMSTGHIHMERHGVSVSLLHIITGWELEASVEMRKIMRIIRFQADGHEYTAIHSQETLQYGVQVHPLDGEITNPMQFILMVM